MDIFIEDIKLTKAHIHQRILYISDTKKPEDVLKWMRRTGKLPRNVERGILTGFNVDTGVIFGRFNQGNTSASISNSMIQSKVLWDLW